MGIDASIIAGIRQPDIKFTDPMELYASGLRLKALMGQNNLQDIQQQTAQQNFDQNNAFKALFANGARPTVDQAMGASPIQGMAFQKTQLENQKTRGDISKNTIDIGAKKSAMYRDALTGVDNPAAAAEWMKAQHDDTDMAGTPIGQTDVQTSISKIPQDAAGFAQWKQQAALGMTKYIEANKPQITSQNMGGSERIVATPGLGGAPVVLDDTRKSVSPDTQMFINQGSGDTGPMDLSKVSPADLQAGYRYKQDGTLPPNMGRGIQGSMQATKIRNIAAQLSQNEGTDNADVRGSQYDFKNTQNIHLAAEKNFAQGKNGQAVRSFNVALAHLDTLSNLSDALDNGNAPSINKFSNMVATQTGGAAPTNFEAAKKIVGDEIVKAIVGSGGGVADREEAAKTISAASSPAQLKGVISTYKELMNGQLGGLKQQYEASTGKHDFNKFLSPEALATTGHTTAPSKPSISGSTSPVKISGDDGYNALPKGAHYIGPDNVLRTK